MHCPISYADWRFVPENFKDDVWNGLMSEFEFNVPSSLVRPSIEELYPQKFRSFKYRLRRNLFRIANSKAQVQAAIQAGLDPNAWKSKEQILAKVPIGITPKTWTAFVNNEFKEGVKESHAKKSENKMQCTIPHTLGRRTYVNKCHLLAKEEGILADDCDYAWMKCHKRKDGTVHPSAAEKYEQVKAAYEKRKEEGTSRSNDFGSDGLVEVFGSDKGKRTLRGFSSSVSKKRVKQAFLTAAICESTNKCNSPVIGLKKVMAQKISINGPTTEGPTLDDTYSPNLDFNPVNPSFTRNMDAASDSQSFSTFGYDESANDDESANQNVNLLDRDGNIVATGYVNERKVFIECIYNVSAPIWDPPQGDGYYQLAAYAAGVWVVWHKKRLQFLN
ncbi:hypothetical protein MKW94_001615 [Papaver nudicaule]|uniref:Transposase n=1 Tax=Papaver nudicaule TaxID=74823 RepID=A0AA41S9B6_PAPNU|nr:hypothetical protein [Papaver nudicaule]